MKRDEQTEEAIAAARADYREAESRMADEREPPTPSEPTDDLVLSGADAAAWRALRAASKAALAAQQQAKADIARTGQELRAAIEIVCKLMAPPTE